MSRENARTVDSGHAEPRGGPTPKVLFQNTGSKQICFKICFSRVNLITDGDQSADFHILDNIFLQ